MTLGDIVHETGTDDKTLRLLNLASDGVDVAAIREYFASQAVTVERGRTESGRPRNLALLESDGRFLAADRVGELDRYVGGLDEPGRRPLREEPPAVVDAMVDTRFESYDKRRMIHASRIVEVRGWNVGSGELHAGFQNLSKIDFQTNVYRNLSREGLDVHVYGTGDEETVRSAAEMGLNVHESDAEEVRRHWWVAFDGDGRNADKSLLLAQERAPNEFYGFWTDDPGVVDDTIDRLGAVRAAAST